MPDQDDADRARFDVDSLYREHAAALYAWACLRLEPRLRAVATPEDLTQEIWLRATRLFATRQGHSGPPRAWLFTIAKHVLFEVQRAVRNRATEASVAGGTAKLALLEQVPVEVTSLTQRLARDDDLRAFLRRAEALDQDERMLLVHVGLEAMSQADVAMRMGVQYDTLAKRWQRLRDRVRQWPSAQALLV
jgi:RNA polymerase sigma-70 factor (ECF subfamily)